MYVISIDDDGSGQERLVRGYLNGSLRGQGQRHWQPTMSVASTIAIVDQLGAIFPHRFFPLKQKSSIKGHWPSTNPQTLPVEGGA